MDFSVFFDKGFVASLTFIPMLLPHGHPDADGNRKNEAHRHHTLREAAGYKSPIEWLDSRCPTVSLTAWERDFFYR
ncbi:hypothetical protein AAGW05_00115 [Arthrobacter sp. LAPM80]|uniref:hypothetical protein n=1 Tax=Arthrobacter sp. LAPM80 TaxID=3141788 RepID=UPI00398AD8BC